MKYLKMFGLAAVAAAAVTAAVGAGSASATVLCNNTTTFCTVKYVAPTGVEGTLIGSSVLEVAGSINECSESTFEGEIEKNGSETETFTVKLTKWTWNCKVKNTKTIANGMFEVHHINTTDNGTVTEIGTETTTEVGGATCTYGTGVGIDLGTFVGGNNPILTVSVKIKKTAGGMLCPTEPTWTAEYKIARPTAPLWIEPK